MRPAISVLMPVHNAAKFVGQAVASVLAQTVTDFELVVVDDASTDATPQVLASFTDPRVRVIRAERNAGVAASLNLGLGEARAPIIARQDADDVSEPTRFAEQLRVFTERPDIGLVGTQGQVIDEAGTPCGTIDRSLEATSIRWYALFDNPFIHSSVMFRRSLAAECGDYDAMPKPYPQDFALWCRMLRKAEAINLAPRLVKYRLTRGSIHGPLAFGTAPEEYRRAFAEVVTRIVRENLEALGSVVTDDEAALLARYVPGVPGDRLTAYLAVFERVLREFERRHGAAASTRDFRRTLARQYDAIAVRVQPPRRHSATRVYAAALTRRPALAAAFDWPRLAALVVLGHAGRQRGRQMLPAVTERRARDVQ